VAVSLAFGFAMASGTVMAASKCTMARIEEWPIRLVRNQLVVDGAINGRKIGIALDTGAMLSLVLRRAAIRLELPRQEVKGLRIFGIGGESQVEVAIVGEFTIGQVSLKDWRLYVAGEQSLDDGADVLLGEDFLHAFDVEFDLAHNAVRLFQSRGCDGMSLAYWTTDVADEVEIEPVADTHPEIVLAVQINGQPVRAKLDSGSSSSVLTKRDAAAAGVTPETPGVVAVGKILGLGASGVDNWIGPFQSFVIGNEIVRDTKIRFGDLYKDTKYTATGSNIRRSVEQLQPMLLGADFLRAHRVLVAHGRRKLYFTYAGGPVFGTGSMPPPAVPPRWMLNPPRPRPTQTDRQGLGSMDCVTQSANVQCLAPLTACIHRGKSERRICPMQIELRALTPHPDDD
jgi:predicted aspartyl protease